MLNVEVRLRILQVPQGHTDISHDEMQRCRDGFIYFISYMEKSLYAKELSCFPEFPLTQSSENLSADLTGGSQKSNA